MTKKKKKQHKPKSINKIKMAENTPVNSAPNFTSMPGNQDWVDYKTGDNKQQYPDMLIDLKTNSSYHGSILDTKIRLVAGKGLVVEDNDQQTIDFLSELNGDGEDINDIIPQISYDLEIFGAFALQVIWNTSWTKISEIRYVRVDKLRAGVIDEEGKVPHYFNCYDWSRAQSVGTRKIPAFNYGVAKTKAEEYDRLNSNYLVPEMALFKQESNSQILYFKIKNGKSPYYPAPTYSGLIDTIIGDIGADKYISTGLSTGFSPQVLINVVGDYDEDEAKEVVDTVMSNYTKGIESNTAMIDIAPTKEESITVTPIVNTTKEDRFLAISESAQQKIIAGHRIPPIIACIETSGKLGNRDEIENAYELFHSTVIKVEQEYITKTLNKILKINGLKTVTIDKRELFEDDSIDNNAELGSTKDNTDNIKE